MNDSRMNVSAALASCPAARPEWQHADNEAVQRLEGACRAAADGRRAARELAAWCKQFALSEPEFQLLWRLRYTSGDGLDQATLAAWLALSPANVSTSVERLRVQGWIAHRQAPGDRRRNLWQLTAEGQELLARMLASAQELRIAECPPRRVNSLRISQDSPQSAIFNPKSTEEAA